MKKKYIISAALIISIACSEGIAHRSEKASKNSGWLDSAKDKIALSLGAAGLLFFLHQKGPHLFKKIEEAIDSTNYNMITYEQRR